MIDVSQLSYKTVVMFFRQLQSMPVVPKLYFGRFQFKQSKIVQSVRYPVRVYCSKQRSKTFFGNLISELQFWYQIQSKKLYSFDENQVF